MSKPRKRRRAVSERPKHDLVLRLVHELAEQSPGRRDQQGGGRVRHHHESKKEEDVSDHQRQFSREEIKEHLRAGTWKSLRSDDRVYWSDGRHLTTNSSVLSCLRNTGRRQELRQLLAAEKEGQTRDA
jgi:hypothetical protein